MQITSLAITEVLLIIPTVHRDARGLFCETFRARALLDAGITDTFVQDNHSLSLAKGVVRGLHFQAPPRQQGKLVRVCRGSIFDVAVDIREGSPTFGRHVTAVLSAANWLQMWIPPGFAHGFCTLEPETEVLYKVTEYYAPEYDRGLRWDDPALAIDWPVSPQETILSPKDMGHPRLEDLRSGFSM